MCGILVIISKTQKPLIRGKCVDAFRSIYTRGPDVQKYQFFEKKRLFIGNSILSITGKVNKSKKLYKSKNKKNYIAFNGEIFNYKKLQKKYFKNKFGNDTAFLVNFFEKKKNSITKDLNGMYAFVIYDISKKKVHIFNDPQGEKTLFFYENQEYCILSSSPEPILKFLSQFEYNLDSLRNYFLNRHYTIFKNFSYKNIEPLVNGSYWIYNLKLNYIKKTIHDNPLNWISKKMYRKLDKMNNVKISNYLEKKLIEQARLMIPNLKFGSIVSGGIDSTLQTKILSKIKSPDYCLSVLHKNKDKILKYKKKDFERKLNLKVNILNFDEKKYYKNLLECYKITKSPLFTHDLPSRLILSKEFKRKKCKVFFNADGCDELLGGQQIYLKSFRNIDNLNSHINHSPYSSINKKIKIQLLSNPAAIKNELNKFWLNVNKKYNFLNGVERNIQSSLFLDYFYQSINVANKSNDLICCHNSIEPRNIFIQKNILRILINLPLKHKFNLNEKNKLFMQKGIFKQIFVKYFGEKLILKKEGFSGYPNSVKKFIKRHSFEKVEKILKIKISKHRNSIPKDLEWKLINLVMFFKTNKQKLINEYS